MNAFTPLTFARLAPILLASALGALSAGLAGCEKHSTSGGGPEESALIGKWADLSNAPGTLDRQCCFYDSTAGDPCGPDTLILRRDSSMSFTSVIDEPLRFWVDEDTLYRFRGDNRADAVRFAFSIRHDTLSFAVSPLCDHNPISSRYRKVPE
ncbi:MAG: hypothetical protein JWP91_1170 [Fibrobacteres bacterium]|nr:hypothetical protein [Fibrobacterota bacterium]